MQIYLGLAILFICVMVGGYSYFKMYFMIQESIKKTLKESLEILPIGVYARCIKNSKRQYLFFNTTVQTIYGHKDVLNAPSWIQADDDTADEMLISGQQSYYEKEISIRTPKNKIKYAKIEKKRIAINKNEFYIITTLQDITEQRKQQFLLEENHKDITLAMNAGRIFIWKYNTQEEMFVPLIGNSPIKSGMNLNEVLTYLHKEDQELFSKLLNRLIQGEIEEDEMILRILNPATGSYSYYKSRLNRRYDPIENQLYIIGSQRNITQKRIKELEMQNIRKSLDLAIQAASIIVWDYNIRSKKYRILYGNYETEFVSNVQDRFSNIHPEDQEKYKRFINGLINKDFPGDKGSIQIRMCYGQPNFHHYKGIIQITRGTSDKAESLIGTFIDITKQIEDDSLIQQNAEFLHTVLDNIPFPTHVKDVTDGYKYLYWNKASKALFGDCTNRRASYLLTPEQAKQIDELDKMVYETEKSYQEQGRLHLLDGRTFDTIVYKNIIYNGNKRLVLTVRWDIGELLKLQHYLEDVCRRDEIIINNTNSGLAYITTDFVVQWENISLCSPEISYETYKKGELCFKSAYGRSTPCEECLLKRVMESKTGEQKHFDLENGRHIEVLANPVLQQDGDIEGIVIRVDDITERQKMMEELKNAKEKAEESDKLKTAFLANISHEIRTPLNAIIGFSNLLLHTKDEGEKEQFSKIIANNNEILLRLINDILELSKIETGMINLREEEIDLTDLFNEIEASFIFKIDKDIKLVSNLPRKRYKFNTDPDRLKQVMNNFLINATKFTSQGYIEIGYEYIDNGIRCYVSDTGIGIKANDRERIFERFEKVDRFSQGTGLGLSICKAIAEACQGKIGVESERGKGSTFWIWIPNTNLTNKS